MAVVAAFVLSPGSFGPLVHDGIDPGTQTSIVWHESLGVTIFCLTFLRLVWGDVHKLLGTVTIWLAGTHALAALYHHFRLKDKVLISMLPSKA